MAKSIQLKNRNNEKIYPNPHYPVGSIYLSVNDTNPTTWFGGTWELIAKGRTLVGVDPDDTDFNTVKKTGGEKTHQLTIGEMPKHHFAIRVAVGYNGNASQYRGAFATNTDWWGGANHYDENNKTNELGSDQPHNNLQPYFTCYIWCRTA